MLFVIVLSLNVMISCSSLSRVLIGSRIFTGSDLHIRIYKVQKGVCRPKRLLPHDVKCRLFRLFSF